MKTRPFRSHLIQVPALALAWAALISSSGCGGAEMTGDRMEFARSPMPTSAAMPVTVSERGDQAAGPSAEVPPAQPRKIVYNAQITLVVENITALRDKLTAMVKEAGGYVAETDISSYTQAQQRATWKLRIPVERFDTFLNAVSALGELQQSKLDSQDVTQEFYDIEARIANKQQEEKRLNKHLTDSTGKLEDILAVEKELTRVRGEIEQMQGRIRYLANVSALSTVTITATEVREYVPPVAPTFAGQIARTFERSLSQLTAFLREAVLLIVALVPWLPVLLVFGLVVLWVVRRVRRELTSGRRPAPVELRPAPSGRGDRPGS